MSPTEPAALGFDPQRLDRINAWAAEYVASGKLPNMQVLVSRHGQLAWQCQHGVADVARGTALNLGTTDAQGASQDTIYRIYSMTKPLTSVAAMMLYERGLFQLDDPIKRWLPKLSKLRVYTGGKGAGGMSIRAGLAAENAPLDAANLPTEAQHSDITFRQLLTHTAGFTYDFMQATPVDALYRQRGINALALDGTLQALADKLAEAPLLAQPGSQWNYSVATDVLGLLVQLIADQPFDDFLREQLLRPLGMADTDFYVPTAKAHRLAACYAPAITSQGVGLKLIDEAGAGTAEQPITLPTRFLTPPSAPSGGGGLLGTGADYLHFCHMMLGGGTLGGRRYLGRKTVAYMLQNHLFKDGQPADMAALGQPRFSESSYEGVGFGLGFSVVLDPAASQTLTSVGEAAWGGAASTGFWLDPAEDLAVVVLTQLMPSSTYPLRRQLRSLVYQALV